MYLPSDHTVVMPIKMKFRQDAFYMQVKLADEEAFIGYFKCSLQKGSKS